MHWIVILRCCIEFIGQDFLFQYPQIVLFFSCLGSFCMFLWKSKRNLFFCTAGNFQILIRDNIGMTLQKQFKACYVCQLQIWIEEERRFITAICLLTPTKLDNKVHKGKTVTNHNDKTQLVLNGMITFLTLYIPSQSHDESTKSIDFLSGKNKK